MSLSTSLAQEIDALQQKLTQSLAGIGPEDALRQPADNCWSVVQCLEHLFLVERGIVRLLQQAPADKPAAEGPNEVAGRGKIDYLLANRSRKVTAPEQFEPRGRFAKLNEATEALAEVRKQLATLLREEKIGFNAFTIPHPRLGDLTRLDWIHFLIAHSERHRHQIEEIKAALSPQS